MIVAVLQARMSSSRLPGKVLKPILGEPMLARQVERVRRSTRVDRLVIATSDQLDDRPIAELAEGLGVAAWCGSLDDVLSRVADAARAHGASQVVRLTGDCPLADPGVIDAVVEEQLRGGWDVTNNVMPRTFPDGLDVEVATFAALDAADREATRPADREHVMPFLYDHPERFKRGSVVAPEGAMHGRWTVDEPADFELVSGIYQRLYADRPAFDRHDIARLLEREPELAALNADIVPSRFRRTST